MKKLPLAYEYFFRLVNENLPADEEKTEQNESISDVEFIVWLCMAFILVGLYGVLRGFTIS